MADNSDHFYGASATIGGIAFSSSPAGLDVSGKNDCVGICSGFNSAFLDAGNGGILTATLPGGETAIGLNVGYLYGTTGEDSGNELSLTLTGSSGVLDTRTTDLTGLATGLGSEEFVGYIVTGDTIQSLGLSVFSGGCCVGIDNIELAGTVTGPSAPEPSTLVLPAIMIGVFLWLRRRTLAR